jgi:hypothetical protein
MTKITKELWDCVQSLILDIGYHMASRPNHRKPQGFLNYKMILLFLFFIFFKLIGTHLVQDNPKETFSNTQLVNTIYKKENEECIN